MANELVAYPQMGRKQHKEPVGEWLGRDHGGPRLDHAKK